MGELIFTGAQLCNGILCVDNTLYVLLTCPNKCSYSLMYYLAYSNIQQWNKFLFFSCPSGSVPCWVFLSTLEVLFKCQKVCDNSPNVQLHQFFMQTADLWSYARLKLHELGNNFNHSSWLLGVSRKLRLIRCWLAFTILSVPVLELTGVRFFAKQAKLYSCGINTTFLICHLDLSYARLNSIRLDTLPYYSIWDLKSDHLKSGNVWI